MDYEGTLNQILENFLNEGGCEYEDSPNGKCRLFSEIQCFYETVKGFKDIMTNERNTTSEQELTRKKPKFKVGQDVYDEYSNTFNRVCYITAKIDNDGNILMFYYGFYGNNSYSLSEECLISLEEYEEQYGD